MTVTHTRLLSLILCFYTDNLHVPELSQQWLSHVSHRDIYSKMTEAKQNMTNALLKDTFPNTHRNGKTKVGWPALTNLTVLPYLGWLYRESESDSLC